MRDLAGRAAAALAGDRCCASAGRRRTDSYWPWQSAYVVPLDTGGTFRAAWRQQDPAVDPREPNGGEVELDRLGPWMVATAP